MQESKKEMRFGKLLTETYKETVRDQYQNIASGLAFYLFLSIGPLIGFTIFLSDKIFGDEITTSKVIPFLRDFFSAQVVKVIIFFLQRNDKIESEGIYTLSILAGVALLFSTKEYFGMVKDSIELTWNIRGDKPGIKYLFYRMIEDMIVTVCAFGIIFVCIIIGYFLDTIFSGISKEVSSLLFEFILFFTLSYFCFLLLTPIKVHWKNALIPGIVGGLTQLAGREVMKIVTGNYQEAGIAESFLLVLFWFYYSSIAFIFTAEFAKIYISRKQGVALNSLLFKE